MRMLFCAHALLPPRQPPSAPATVLRWPASYCPPPSTAYNVRQLHHVRSRGPACANVTISPLTV
ncbi:hypothetical protein BD779DRAFT_1554431 [Infundibulicybe gibba]|nr:hypothetical protein BD779DRAFT_1554431 [Infundibulicybe gibba]